MTVVEVLADYLDDTYSPFVVLSVDGDRITVRRETKHVYFVFIVKVADQ